MGVFTHLNNYESLKTEQEIMETFKHIFELADVIESGEFLGMITESDIPRIKESIDEFTERAHDYIDRVKENKKRKEDIAAGWALATLGLYIVGIAAAAAVPVLGTIILIGAIISIIISAIYGAQAVKEFEKLEDFKSKLLVEKSRVKGDREKQKIAEIIDRIDHEIERHDQKQPSRNVNYNYNM